MDDKKTYGRITAGDVMLQDSEYYKYIFKKTEKIACAVFYILSDSTDKERNETVIQDVEDAAKTLLDTALASLNTTKTDLDIVARELRFQLVALESELRVAHASRAVGTQYLEVFLREIASLQRALRSYTERGMANPLEVVDEPVFRTPSPARTLRGTPAASTPLPVSGQSRTDRILAVVKDKGSATIKDIADVVTDCSEKTIQRELIGLIKDGKVHREGERRWSKYTLAF